MKHLLKDGKHEAINLLKTRKPFNKVFEMKKSELKQLVRETLLEEKHIFDILNDVMDGKEKLYGNWKIFKDLKTNKYKYKMTDDKGNLFELYVYYLRGMPTLKGGNRGFNGTIHIVLFTKLLQTF